MENSIGNEDYESRDYLVFIPGEILNKVISVKGKLLFNISWSDTGELVCEHYSESGDYKIKEPLESVLKSLNASPELKHGVYKSVLKSIDS
jgi:hypothetical protein